MSDTPTPPPSRHDMPAPPSAQAVLSILGLLVLAGFGLALIWHAVPDGNVQLLTFILGAIAGAVTGSTATRLAGPGANP